MKKIKSWILVGLLSLCMTGQVFASGVGIGDILDLPEWQVTGSSYGGKLLLSDSPEMVQDVGIMYRDTVDGNARLFFHHVNDTSVDKKIVVVLENNGSKKAVVTVSQVGIGGPGKDWMAVGKLAQQSYMAGSDIYSIELSPKGIGTLSPVLDEAVVQPGALVNGIFDFRTSQPVTVKVMMLPVDEDVQNFSKQAKILPTDEHRLRGTFEGCNRMLIPFKVYNPAIDGAVAITLADNNLDKYVTGIDATDGSAVLNYGNYGVVYNLFLPSEGSGKFSSYISPRGGAYAGAIGVKYQHSGQYSVATPADRLYFGEPTDYAAIGVFENESSLWLSFSPPGASNLPVRLILAPQ